jgi:hypothetical protein
MALAAGVAALVIGPVGAALAASDSSGRVATVSQGWWNQTPAPVAVPDNPVTGLAPIPAAPQPDVPEGVVPVTMRLGQVSRVAALGMTFDAPAGTQVNRLVLRLPEAEGALAQQGSGAAVRACPITDFLVAEENGDAANTPAADCDVAQAAGERADDGTWTFDLTTIAQAWASGAVTVNGIRLDPVGEAPASFQVGFAGYDDATIEADLVAGQGGSDPFGDLSTGSTDDFGSGFVSDVGAGFTDPGPTSGTASASAAAPAAATPRRTVPIAASEPGSSFIGSAPANLLVLLGLVVLGLATMLQLGSPVDPGEAATATRRVSRPVGARARMGVRRA